MGNYEKSNRKAMNRNWGNQKANPALKTKREINKYYKKTAQQKFSMDFFFVLILVRIRNDFFEVINKYGNPLIHDFSCPVDKT